MPTTLFARILGLWSLLAVCGMIANRENTVAFVNAFFADPPLMWVTGVFTLLLGIFIVVAHNRWTDGPTATVVTLYGWIALLKGLTFVWLPPSMESSAFQSLHFGEYFYAYFVLSLALGIYLTYGGFFSKKLS